MKRVRRILIGSILSLLLFSGGYLLLASLVREPPFLDERLAAAVREELGISGKYIPVSELEGLTELDAADWGIESLEGIEHLPNLRHLHLGGNRIGDVRPLTALNQLVSLDLHDNFIHDLAAVHLDSLAELGELSVLSLRNNRESTHPEERETFEMISDISLLSELTTLEVLDLRNNHIEVISPLQELDALRRLDLRGNRLTEDAVESLGTLYRLEHLNLRDNDLRDISALSSLEQLEYLNLHSNSRIESVIPLSALSGLRTLILRDVPVGEDAGVLRELVNLQRLNVRETGLRDLTVLADLMEQGALQDRPEDGITAEVDIRENPIGASDEYTVLKPYWQNIADRHPVELPE